MNFSGVVLAGGENKRYQGVVKATLIVNGKPIIERTLELFNRLFDEIVIVTNNSEAFSSYKQFRMVEDIYKGIGPLGGLHAALHDVKSDAIFMAASDMPWLSEELIQSMINYFEKAGCEVLLPRYNGKDEPLHAIYATSVKDSLDNFLGETNRFAIREFLKLVKVEYFNAEIPGSERNPFANINRPEDMQGILNGAH